MVQILIIALEPKPPPIMKTILTTILAMGVILTNAQVSVKSYGAKGDGVTDDGPAIQKALNSGNKQVYFEAGKLYRTGSVLTVPSSVTVTGNGATLKPTSTFTTKYSKAVIGTYDFEEFTKSSLSISVTKGSSTFTYSSASSLKVGSFILVQGPQYCSYNEGIYKYGWYGYIKSISGTTVTMSSASIRTFTGSAITQYYSTKYVHIKGLNVNLKGRTIGMGIGLFNSYSSSVENCFVESDPTSTSAEVGLYGKGVSLTFTGNKVRNIRVGSSIGYGINVEGHYITVKSNDVAVARHCITSAGRYFMSTNLLIKKNTVNCGNGAAPIDFHGNANGTIDSNTVSSVTPNITAISVRNSYTVISNNNITVNNVAGINVYGISIAENAYRNITITKNKVYFKGTGGGVSAVADFSVGGTIDYLSITNNYFQGGVRLNGTLGTATHVDSNKFEGNTVYNPTIQMNASSIKEYYIQGNTFINNFDSRFNYILSSPTCNTAYGYIRNNKVYCTNPLNLVAQFRINNPHNVLENNVFYTQYKYPLIDYSSDKQNWINNSKRVDNVPVTTLITYSEIPKATSFFYNKTIAYKNSTGSVYYYKCVKSSTGSYSWQKQSTSIAV